MSGESSSASRNELLDVDLRKSEVAPYFPSDVHSLTGVLPPNSGLLQVMGITNIAQPLQKRNDNASTPRLLLLTLSDGHTKVSGIELQPISALKCSMAPGFKILYKGGRVINGRLILTPDNVEVLGGRVIHLLESWKANESALRQRSGKGPRSKDGPPQFNLALDKAKAAAAKKPTMLVSDLPQPLSATQPLPQPQLQPGKRSLQAPVTATVIPGGKERERDRDFDSGRDTGGSGRGRGGDRDRDRDRDRGGRERGRDRQAPEPALQSVQSVQSIDWYIASAQSAPQPLPRPPRNDQDNPPARRERDRGHPRGRDAEPFAADHSPPRPLSPPPALNLAAEAQFPTLPAAPQPQPQSHPRHAATQRSPATTNSIAHTMAQFSLAPAPPRVEEDLGLLAYCKPNVNHRQGKAKIKGQGLGKQGEQKTVEPWSCAVCTFLNHPDLALCEMCDSAPFV